MQHLKNFNWKKFLLQGVLPCLLAVAVGFISRYQLELSDGVTESFLQLQWPLYAPLNALTAFCLTLILFALLGKWSRATGISGAVFTIIALINYYTRDLHGSALMPQDILNLGTAAEVMGSYTLKITQDVVKIVLLYLPILAIVFVQAQLVKGAPKRAGWKARGVRAAGSALGVFLVMFFGYFGPVTIKPKTTYGWAWQNTYYTYGYLAGTHARDKDAVTASLLLTEMAAWYHAQGMTLFDALRSLYEKYGWYGEKTHNLVMPGLDGAEKMAALMKSLRETPPSEIAGVKVATYKDYSDGTARDAASGEVTKIALSGSNVLRFELCDGTHIVVRPSGTEPKIKVYILTKGADAQERDANLAKYSAWVNTLA